MTEQGEDRRLLVFNMDISLGFEDDVLGPERRWWCAGGLAKQEVVALFDWLKRECAAGAFGAGAVLREDAKAQATLEAPAYGADGLEVAFKAHGLAGESNFPVGYRRALGWEVTRGPARLRNMGLQGPDGPSGRAWCTREHLLGLWFNPEQVASLLAHLGEGSGCEGLEPAQLEGGA